MTVLIDSLKNLYLNISTAFKDRVDLIIFLFAAAFSYIDITGTHLKGAIGFLTFYLFFLLSRYGYFKRKLAEKDKIV